VKSFQFKRRQRGSVTVWLSEDAREAWCHTGQRKPGGRRVYSNAAIETFWTIRMIYGLALRQTEGFIRSLFEETSARSRCCRGTARGRFIYWSTAVVSRST
jgi:hypothetical protein